MCGGFGKIRPEQAILMQPEVLSADQCEHFLEQSLGRSSGSGWMKSLLTGRKSESALSDSARKQLHYILSSAPTWDRSIIVPNKKCCKV